MKTNCVLLSVFRLHDTLNGEAVRSFDDYLVDPGSLKAYDLGSEHSFKARLYVPEQEEKEPPWAAYLRNGFSDLDTPPKPLTSVYTTGRVSRCTVLRLAVKLGTDSTKNLSLPSPNILAAVN